MLFYVWGDAIEGVSGTGDEGDEVLDLGVLGFKEDHAFGGGSVIGEVFDDGFEMFDLGVFFFEDVIGIQFIWWLLLGWVVHCF
jgi:hypothetical protein